MIVISFTPNISKLETKLRRTRTNFLSTVQLTDTDNK